MISEVACANGERSQLIYAIAAPKSLTGLGVNGFYREKRFAQMLKLLLNIGSGEIIGCRLPVGFDLIIEKAMMFAQLNLENLTMSKAKACGRNGLNPRKGMEMS